MNDQMHKKSYFPHHGAAPEKQPQPSQSSSASDNAPTWMMLLHLSQFAHVFFPTLGVVAPIVIWQIKKEEFPQIEEHGKEVCNWIITQLIFGFVAGLLVFVLIGIPLLGVLAILSMVFPIIGSVKAADGKLWRYPLTIRILK